MRVNLKNTAHGDTALNTAHIGDDVQLFDRRGVKLDMSDVTSVVVNFAPQEVATVTVTYNLIGLGDGK
jgi:hypothetical protein